MCHLTPSRRGLALEPGDSAGKIGNMKRITLLVVLLSGLGLLASLAGEVVPAMAEPNAASPKEYYQGQALCLPAAYPQEPDGCLPMGPSSRLTDYDKLGISIPAAPIPARSVAATLGVVPYQYLLAVNEAVPVYSTQADAASKNTRRTLLPGKKYLAYKQRVENAQGVFYQIQTGEWIRGESVSSRVGYSTDSRGAIFEGVPHANFGWTIETLETRSAPGYKSPLTGRKIQIYTLVWAYAVQHFENADWVMVGPDEWIDDHFFARVAVDTTPPEGVTNGRWVEINLGEQTVSVYDNNRLVFAALAATGVKNMATRPGLYHVTKKVPAEHMTGAFEADRSDFYYLESVPWTIYFDDARALHGIYWRTNFGRPASHGCVNLTIADARWLYDWIKEGDAVFSWDGVTK